MHLEKQLEAPKNRGNIYVYSDSDDPDADFNVGENADTEEKYKVGSFVVVRVYTKNRASFRYNVSKVLNVTDGDIEVQFLQRLLGTYKFKLTNEKSYIQKCDLVCDKLPSPNANNGKCMSYIGVINLGTRQLKGTFVVSGSDHICSEEDCERVTRKVSGVVLNVGHVEIFCSENARDEINNLRIERLSYAVEVSQTDDELSMNKRQYVRYNLDEYVQGDKVIELKYGGIGSNGRVLNMFNNSDKRIWMSICLSAADAEDARIRSEKIKPDQVRELQIYAKMWHKLGDKVEGRARIVQIFGEMATFKDIKNMMSSDTDVADKCVGEFLCNVSLMTEMHYRMFVRLLFRKLVSARRTIESINERKDDDNNCVVCHALQGKCMSYIGVINLGTRQLKGTFVVSGSDHICSEEDCERVTRKVSGVVLNVGHVETFCSENARDEINNLRIERLSYAVVREFIYGELGDKLRDKISWQLTKYLLRGSRIEEHSLGMLWAAAYSAGEVAPATVDTSRDTPASQNSSRTGPTQNNHKLASSPQSIKAKLLTASLTWKRTTYRNKRSYESVPPNNYTSEVERDEEGGFKVTLPYTIKKKTLQERMSTSFLNEGSDYKITNMEWKALKPDERKLLQKLREKRIVQKKNSLRGTPGEEPIAPADAQILKGRDTRLRPSGFVVRRKSLRGTPASTAAGSSRISLVRSIDLLEQQPTVTSRTTEAEDEIRLAAADQYRRQQQRRQRAIISDPTVSSTTTAEEDDARYEADRRRRQQDETR
ncbi:hypothetical protein M8J76_009265 [Diaphorina citri]|nr:hypothetical protein M8J76_009265 [Diaphorina citri]